ncbi:unnamed protein product [Boreogadus saida]
MKVLSAYRLDPEQAGLPPTFWDPEQAGLPPTFWDPEQVGLPPTFWGPEQAHPLPSGAKSRPTPYLLGPRAGPPPTFWGQEQAHPLPSGAKSRPTPYLLGPRAGLPLSTAPSRFTRLEAAIKKAIPDAEVTGSVGRAQSFEVTVNGQLVHSKLQTGSFPDDSKVVKQLMAMKTPQAYQRPPQTAHRGG